MVRDFLACAALASFLAPGLIAQSATVCVFPAKEAHGVNTYVQDEVQALTVALQKNGGASIQAVSVPGVDPKQIDAEAQHRSCSYVVTLWRQEIPPDSPNYAGTLGGSQASVGYGTNLMRADTKIPANTLLDYALRKADAHKPMAHGETDNKTPYGKVAEEILKKIAEKK